MARTAIRLVIRLALITGLVLIGRAVFKRWVEGPEPVVSDPRWEPRPDSPSPQAEAAPLFIAAEAAPVWIKGNGDGHAPASHPVKAKVASRVYRVPGMASYEQAKPDRCYPTPEAAEADGFTRAKR
jgi:hypothetical protein